MSRVLITLDPYQVKHATRFNRAAKNDWRRVRRFLDGQYPASIPDMKLWGHRDFSIRDQQSFHDAPFVVIDTEYQYDDTQSRPWDRATELDLVGLYGPGTSVLQIEPSHLGRQEVGAVAAWLRSLICDQTIVFQNTSADVVVLDKFLGIEWKEYGETHDTMFAHAALWAEMPHSLEYLASVYGRHEKLKHLSHSDPLLYNAGDVLETANTWVALERELQDDPKSMHVYQHYLLPLRPIIMASEHRGIRIDQSFVATAQETLTEKAKFAADAAQAYAGYEINLNSGDQVIPLLNEEGIKLKTLKADKLVPERNKHLAIEQREDLTPAKLAERIDDGAHPILEARAAFIQADKQLTAYIAPLFDAGGAVVGRVYPHFLPTAQDNGRWSTTNPPLAQLPEALRCLLIPDKGYPWIGWDWSAIEMRILAAMSRDPKLLEAFEKDWDLHTINTCQIFDLPEPQNLVDPHRTEEDAGWRERVDWLGKDDKRRVFSKTLVYRLIYGGDPKGAGNLPGANKLGLSKPELVRASYRWLSQHPELQEFWQRLRESALTKGEVRSFLGRRRRLQETDAKTRVRQAFDQPCQAGTSDIFNITAIQIAEEMPWAGFVYGMHDSQKWATPLARLAEDVPRIKEIVEQEYDVFGLPMRFMATFDLYFAPEDEHLRGQYVSLIGG